MKGLKYIFNCLLSLTIVYVGVGVPLAKACDCGCRIVAEQKAPEKCSCCKTGKDADAATSKTEKCCKSTVYKIDLVKTSPLAEVVFPNVQVFVQHLFMLLPAPPQEIKSSEWYYDPPEPDTSRYYLNLYSVLLI